MRISILYVLAMLIGFFLITKIDPKWEEFPVILATIIMGFAILLWRIEKIKGEAKND